MKNEDFVNWITELRSRCDIVSVISKYTYVVQRGRYFWACCPFHMEKDPSLCIYDDEQCFYCYGCKEFGDVIKFVKNIESCDYIQAVEMLAKSVNMEVPKFSKESEESFAKRKRDRDTALAILDEANKYYQSNLYLPKAKIAQEYIKKRGLTKRELVDFGLGYSDGSRGVINHLQKLGYTVKQMDMAGILSKADDGYYDAFSHRLTFPLYNSYGECIGFSARILIEDSSRAKYKNSQNTIVFEKSKTVFGLNLVKKYKQLNKIPYIVIVEGQMDVIAMHKSGFKNTVACLGTAFTDDHAKLLKLVSDSVVLCLDGDSAGMKAAFKNSDILAKHGFIVRCVTIPNNMDPDEYIGAYGKDGMQKLLESAVNYIDFQIDYLAKDKDMTQSDEKAKFVTECLELLSKLGTNSEKQVYLGHISKISSVPIDVLQQDIMNATQSPKPIYDNKRKDQSEDGANRAIKYILASMLYEKEYARFVDLEKYVHNDSYKKMFNLIKERKNTGKKVIISSLFNDFEENDDQNLVEIINYNFDQIGNNEKYYNECVWCLVERDLKKQMAELNEKASKCTDINERNAILYKINDITKKLKNKEVED